MELYEKLYELRRASGMSQEELAEKLGVSRQAVSKWETGKGYPDISLLEPLAAFFRDAIAVSKLSGVYTGPLLKCMTISILTMIGESLCKDAGQAAGACAVQLVGVAAALYAALPLMRTFLTMIGECL